MLKHIKVSRKIIIMLAPLIVGLVYFAATDVQEKARLALAAHTTEELTKVAVKSSLLIHELQKERGLTAGFIGSRGANYRADLEAQREQTDLRLRELKAAAAGDLKAFGRDVVARLNEVLAMTDKLTATRTAAAGLTLSGAQSFSFYTELIDASMTVISTVAKGDVNQAISRRIVAYLAFIHEKEETGKERATLNAVFTANTFDAETYRRFLSIIAAQKVYGDMFAVYATEPDMRIYREKMAGDAAKRVAQMRETAIVKHESGGFDIEPQAWFRTITEMIEVMKGLEEHFSSDIISLAGELERAARIRLMVSAGLAVALLAVAIVTAISVSLSVIRPLREVVATLRTIADGDLTARSTVNGRDELGMLAAGLNEMGEKISEAMQRVIRTAGQVASASAELRSSSEQMATGAEEVASQASAVATASEEMSATTTDIAKNCIQAAEGSSIAADSARSGSDIVSETIAGMTLIAERVRNTSRMVEILGERSDQIGAIASTIDDIADQTNLLALNAAIEAARAGDQGRGFAVVADEVRALAGRTATATKEIGTMIKTIQSDTRQAVRTMEEGVTAVEEGSGMATRSGAALQEILGQINGVTMQVSQIATAAEEQTAVTGEITQNIHQISEIVQMTAQGVQISAAAASELAAMSDELKSLVGKFRLS